MFQNTRHMQRILFAAVLLSMATAVPAQSLYWPRDLKKAYKNETRSNDGYPGKKYWQNTGRYQITISALPPDRTIKGTEAVTYFNNSPDTLGVLLFEFIQNVHKPGATRLGDATDDYLTDGVHVDAYTENGEAKEWGQETGGTVQYIRLSAPLMPHDSVKLTFGWHYQIARGRGISVQRRAG